MRFAIFSDVHGNFHTQEAVLAETWYGGAALPLECIQTLQDRHLASVYGNTDEFLWKLPSEKWRPYLQRLPFELRFFPTQKNISDAILPPIEMQQALKGEINQPDAPLLENVVPRTIVFGHVPNVRQINGYSLVNIASVSRPQDGGWTIEQRRHGRRFSGRICPERKMPRGQSFCHR